MPDSPGAGTRTAGPRWLMVGCVLLLSLAGCGDDPTGIAIAGGTAPESRGLLFTRDVEVDGEWRQAWYYFDLAGDSVAPADLALPQGGHLSLSPSGSTVLQSGVWGGSSSYTEGQLSDYDVETGRERVLATGTGTYSYAEWAPDERRIAVLHSTDTISGVGGDGQLDVLFLDEDGSVQFRRQPDPYQYPIHWSPDGRWLLFGGHPIWSQYKGLRALEVASTRVETIPFPPYIRACFEGRSCAISATDWLASGRIGIALGSAGGPAGLHTMAPDGTDLKTITDGEFWDASWSPDGSLVAAHRFDGRLLELVIIDEGGREIANLGVAAQFLWW